MFRFLADYKRIFSSSKRPDWLRDLTSILYNRHRDVLSSMSERSELEANQFLSSTDEVKNVCSYSSDPSMCLRVVHNDAFTFTLSPTHCYQQNNLHISNYLP